MQLVFFQIKGADEILLEWRRPEVYQDRIRLYKIHLESLSAKEHSRELTVEIMNDTVRNLVRYFLNTLLRLRYN